MSVSEICGWGRYPVITAEARSPKVLTSMGDSMRIAAGSSILARGLGRSYGDSSLNDQVIGMRYLNHLIEFDQQTGVLTSQAGASLAEILEVFVPKGWFLPVTPGTRFITLGGAVASDVHGKNHHVNGCFCEHVERLEVMVAPDRLVAYSPENDADLFFATCGGMGLTGVILTVTLRLKPIRSAFIDQVTFKARNLSRSLIMIGEHAVDISSALLKKRR